MKGILVHFLIFSLHQNNLFVHHIQVEHLYVLYIQITNISQSEVIMFDGPGKKSAVLHPHLSENKQFFVTKTFQLVSHILGEHLNNYSRIDFQGQLATSAHVWSISNSKLFANFKIFFPNKV